MVELITCKLKTMLRKRDGLEL